MRTNPQRRRRRRASGRYAVVISLAFHTLLLGVLALGARRFQPPPEDEAIHVSLVDISLSEPKFVPPASGSQRTLNPRPSDRHDAAAPTIPLAPAPAPSPLPGDQQAQAPPRFDLGCFGLAENSSEKCEKQRWKVQAQNGPDTGIGPLARLDAGKREVLDIIAADQAACLEYKKRPDMAPAPWGLHDIPKKGLC